MMIRTRQAAGVIRRATLCAALLASSLPAAAVAADFPIKPMRYVLGFAAGGAADLVCRAWGAKLTAATGQQVVVENRPGAASELAIKHVMAAPADGYTLLCTTASAGILSAKLKASFDLRTDLAPVIQMTSSTFVFYISPSLPVKSIQELIAYSKARPGKINYGSVGVGSTTHLAFEVFKQSTGLDIVHIPFKGTAQTSVAVMSGEIQVGLDAATVLKPHFDSGKLRPLAVISARRTPTLPEVVGMQEAGIANVDVVAWNGLTAPLKTPREVIDVLNRHYNEFLKDPEFRAFHFKQGFEAEGGSPEVLARRIASEVEAWSRVIRALKIEFD